MKGARLLVPRSAKGHAHKRAVKRLERVPVPVTPDLAARLQQEARDRPAHAPLLLRRNGEPWGRARRYRDDVRAVVTSVGLDPDTATMYSLRHSAISRLLLAGVPVTLVADLADTSEAVIRRHYAKLIAHHADAIARRGLLELSQLPDDNVVSLAGRRS